MKKSNIYALILFIAAAASWTLSPALADTESPSQDPLRMLKVNASMLERFENEYKKLSLSTPHTPESEKKLSALQYKIKSLREDSLRLQRALPKQRIENAPKLEMSKSAESNQLHEKALNLVGEQKLLEAAAIYQDIVLQNPEDDEAYILMGHCYLLSFQYEKARSAFGNAIHISADNVREVTSFYENLILRDPNDDAAHMHLGYALLLLGDNRKALAAFGDALEINGDNLRAREGYNIARSRR